MKHLQKMHGHLHKKHYTTVLLSFLVLLLALYVIFFITRGANPAMSELFFTERSTLGADAGSVVPASCESSYEHYVGECLPTVRLQFR